MFSGGMKVNHLQKHLEQQKRASVDEGVDSWGTLLHCSSAGKESTCSAGDLGSILGLGRSADYPLQRSWASLVAQLIKNPLARRETWVRSLGWEDPLEKREAPIPVFWPGEFYCLFSSWGRKELDMTE